MTVVNADHRGSAKSQPPLNADPCTTGDAGGAQLRGPALGPNARRVPPGEVLAEITKCLVQLHKECYGKGPTKARTYAVGDLVVCVLQGGLTTGDRILLDHGRVDAVVASREAFQEIVRHRLVETVKRLVGRKVVAFVSGMDPQSGTSSELFVLEPESRTPGTSSGSDAVKAPADGA